MHDHGSMSIVDANFHSVRPYPIATISEGQRGQCNHKCRQQLSERTTVESVIEKNSSQIGPEARLKDWLCHLILGCEVLGKAPLLTQDPIPTTTG